jgi:hypothetical protein
MEKEASPDAADTAEVFHASPVNRVCPALGAADSAPNMMQCNIPVPIDFMQGFDSATLERQARAARSAWVGSKLKSFYEGRRPLMSPEDFRSSLSRACRQ